jgi:hypothetical protein
MISEFSSHFQRRVAPSEPRPVADTPAAAAALPASHALLFACGGADDADPAAAALLTTYVLQHVEAIASLVMETAASATAAAAASGAAVQAAAAAGGGGAAAAAAAAHAVSTAAMLAALDSNGVLAVLRAAGLPREAAQAAALLAQQQALASAGLQLDLGKGEEAEAYAAWGEKPPAAFHADARKMLAARAGVMARWLADEPRGGGDSGGSGGGGGGVSSGDVREGAPHPPMAPQLVQLIAESQRELERLRGWCEAARARATAGEGGAAAELKALECALAASALRHRSLLDQRPK